MTSQTKEVSLTTFVNITMWSETVFSFKRKFTFVGGLKMIPFKWEQFGICFISKDLCNFF